MNDFKPSELPVDTIIEGDVVGMFIKRANGVWEEINAHCGDCATIVFDTPTPEKIAEFEKKYDKVREFASDSYFKDRFKIVALPFSLTHRLAMVLNDEYEDANVDQIIRDYIEHLAHEAKRLAEIAEDKK